MYFSCGLQVMNTDFQSYLCIIKTSNSFVISRNKNLHVSVKALSKPHTNCYCNPTSVLVYWSKESITTAPDFAERFLFKKKGKDMSKFTRLIITVEQLVFLIKIHIEISKNCKKEFKLLLLTHLKGLAFISDKMLTCCSLTLVN